MMIFKFHYFSSIGWNILRNAPHQQFSYLEYSLCREIEEIFDFILYLLIFKMSWCHNILESFLILLDVF